MNRIHLIREYADAFGLHYVERAALVAAYGESGEEEWEGISAALLDAPVDALHTTTGYVDAEGQLWLVIIYGDDERWLEDKFVKVLDEELCNAVRRNVQLHAE